MARPPAPCGTFTAYKRHRRNGEPVDEACAAACAAASSARRPAPAGAGGSPSQRSAPASKQGAAKSGRAHRDAVSRMLRATGLLHVPEEALLVVTLKSLAARLDADPDDARARTQWLTAQNQLRQALNVAPGRPKSSPDPAPSPTPTEEPEPTEEPAPVNSLAAFRQRRRIGV